MSYIPLIIKSEFEQYVTMTNNIDDSAIALHIRDAQEIDFISWVDTPFYDKLLSGPGTQLSSLLNDYIKPYLICLAYHRYLLWCGRSPQRSGLRKAIEESSEEISDKARGELMADIHSKSNAYLNKLKYKLYADRYTYDGVIYTFFDEINKVFPRPKISIKQVGRNRPPLTPEERTKYGY